MSTSDNTTIPVKRCTKCGEEKPATPEYWHKQSNGLYGLKSICKVCKKTKDAADWLDPEKGAKKKAAHRSWCKRNRAYLTTKEWLWRRKNPERARQRNHRGGKERRKRYLLRHPELNNLIRARRAKAPGSHTKEEIDAKYVTQQGKCEYCGCELGGKYEMDHVHPLSKGGTNYAHNIVLTCRFCNRSKGSKFVWEWVRLK